MELLSDDEYMDAIDTKPVSDGIATFTFYSNPNAESYFRFSVKYLGDENYYGAETLKCWTIPKTQQTDLVFASNNPTAKTYGNAPFTVTATGGQGSGAVSYEIASGPATVNSSTGLVAITGAGDIGIRAFRSGDFNYYASDFAFLTITVAKVPLTVTADDQSKYFGAADPKLSYSVSPGLVGPT